MTLFAPPGSGSSAEVVELLDETYPDDIQKAQFEADHVARAFGEIDAAAKRDDPYDVIHDHVGHTALAMADRSSVPLVHTLHGPFTEDVCRLYAEQGAWTRSIRQPAGTSARGASESRRSCAATRRFIVLQSKGVTDRPKEE